MPFKLASLPSRSRFRASNRCLPSLTSLGTLLLGLGCAEEPSSKTPTDVDEQPKFHEFKNELNATAEVGALHEEQTADAFKSALPGLQRCLSKGTKRNEFEAGEIAFFVKVNSAAQIEHVHAEDSSLGDRETEKCMFQALERSTWPKPFGGKIGIARNSFSFEGGDVRPPTDWDSDRVEEGLAKLGDQLRECKDGVRGSFSATMYVGTKGEVLGASVTPPDETGEKSVDCLVAALLGGEFEPSGSWPAKVRFQL